MLHSIGVVWVTKEQFELDKKVNFIVEKQFRNVVLRVSLGFQQQLKHRPATSCFNCSSFCLTNL